MSKTENQDTVPCNICGDPVDAEIHEEELGMCVDCSNDYFTHDDEEGETK